ncbi:glycosyl hydrolase family 47 protein [Actinidia rufa]|uniref:Glycosyl hydrolase family 47 protein n=1 Tax=Actinidia rufa TaxID=165716 RepID=A0A7J0DEP9_9ERIC|nr:glycosyl hydrolase family 47 protein [Actinidia rufa]
MLRVVNMGGVIRDGMTFSFRRWRSGRARCLRPLVSCISKGAAVEGEVGADCLEPIFTGLIIDLDGSNVDPWYLEVGESIVDSLNLYAKVEGGFASIRDVTTMELEDHQHSFFLAETCKYLYLLFDDSFLVDRNYIFTTEGHPLPVLSAWHERLPETYIPSNWTFVESEQKAKRVSAMSLQVCPEITLKSGHGSEQVESVCHIPDVRDDHRCLVDEDCGTDAISCRRRSCSMAGYCGLWLFI